MEEWRRFRDTAFEVSNLGRVRRWRADFRCPKRMIKPTPNHQGYHRARFRMNDGTFKNFMIHRMVAEVFLCPQPSPEHEVNHIDANKSNNTPENLEWVLHQDNIDHAVRMNLILRRSGEDHPSAKLNIEEVREIRALYSTGAWFYATLADAFGVKYPTIVAIVRNRIWRSVA